MSIFSQAFYVIIYRRISKPSHAKEVVYGFNAIDKRFIFQLTKIVQLTDTKGYYTQMVMHTITRTSYVGLAREFQKYLLHVAPKHGMIDQGKYKKRSSKQKWEER